MFSGGASPRAPPQRATYQLLTEDRSGTDSYSHTVTNDPLGNRLTQIEDGDTTTYTSAFVKRDNTGQRVSKDDDTTFTRFVWDDERILTELDNVGTPAERLMAGCRKRRAAGVSPPRRFASDHKPCTK